MRFNIFGYVLVLPAVFAILVAALSNGQTDSLPDLLNGPNYPTDFGSDFETELISVGSDVESIGK